ncbi:acyl carrier protein [Streptomyces sp. NBC_01565]|uniref:acyl carrier protein n=1 Tax=unclassified Streptomyces TaxID=2593676 RepID=UPI002252257E|nr:acyl carrier protein [Streptomyces sp. NBC_01565]MCX4545902.1 acyl carrier protein [Streptomyces sp. NBC_01565]
MFRKKAVKPAGPLTQEVLRDWLTGYLADHLKVAKTEIDTATTFESYGLDSRVAVQVSGALEKVVERRLSPGLLYEHTSIDDLSGYLAKELRLPEQAV